MNDPVMTSPELYSVIFENDRVRVLQYLDHPGDKTEPHGHPDSVMVTLSSFKRRLRSNGHEVELELPAFHARWLDEQEHSGVNIGVTRTHAVFIELKEPRPDGPPGKGRLGPSAS